MADGWQEARGSFDGCVVRMDMVLNWLIFQEIVRVAEHLPLAELL
jgi:hypothetical protein